VSTVVSIAAVELDGSGRLLVRPDTRDTGSFDFIYRAGTGVRWRSSDSAFLPDDVKDGSPARWFEIILSSVRGELGLELRLADSTEWISVPAQVRLEIQAQASRATV
jgi:hypothetical protein